MPKKRKTDDAEEFFVEMGMGADNPYRQVMGDTWQQFQEFLESKNRTLEKSGVGAPLRAFLAEHPQALMMVFCSGFVSGTEFMSEVLAAVVQADQQQDWKNKNRVDASKIGRA